MPGLVVDGLPALNVINAQLKLDTLHKLLNQSLVGDDYHKVYRILLLHLSIRSSLVPSVMLLNSADNSILVGEEALVGSGGSAKVFCRRGSGGSAGVAVKKFIYLSNARSLSIKEALIMGSLRHRNVVPFIGVIDASEYVAIVTPYMRNGDMMSFLRRNPRADRIKLAIGIARGMKYLKFCGVIHGDIKAANILVDDENGPVIADFGLSQYEGDETQLHETQQLHSDGSGGGTIRYMAPERLNPGTRSARPTFASDVFAFGMTLYEIYTGRYPYWKLNNTRAMMKIVNGDHPSWDARILDDVWSLVITCWSFNTSDRPLIHEILGRLLEMQRKT
ncbi:hypothetical protein DXG01_003218 [Tephrocybe rancida]|nr:hypothetical protein DXG01_003218 [Tephrocybe rancida]